MTLAHHENSAVLRVLTTLVSVAVLAIVAMGFSATAEAVTVQVGINSTGEGNNRDITGPAGFGPIPLADWTNIDPQSGGGSFKGLTITSNSANAGWRTNDTGLGNLFNGYHDTSAANAATISVSGLNALFDNPTATRTIYAYFGSDGAGRAGDLYLDPVFNVGSQTGDNIASFADVRYFSSQNNTGGGLDLVTSTTDGSHESGNYAVFTIAAGVDSFTVAVARPSSGNASTGLHGISIVGDAIPEPSTAVLAVIGLVCGVCSSRRRNR
ncbi:MAG: PEP-CTERM sorting domain-containing protein [Pirellulales bacterium]|nr:PEP-CTERM sorting domain-containing protein [Pirellulales bacterium]